LPEYRIELRMIAVLAGHQNVSSYTLVCPRPSYALKSHQEPLCGIPIISPYRVS
jgi:hypothetical protein